MKLFSCARCQRVVLTYVVLRQWIKPPPCDGATLSSCPEDPWPIASEPPGEIPGSLDLSRLRKRRGEGDEEGDPFVELTQDLQSIPEEPQHVHADRGLLQ